MADPHTRDNAADRETGEQCERDFCVLAGEYGYTFTPNQIGRNESATAYRKGEGKWNTLLLPDVVIWSAPGQHHEIKHKTTNQYGRYGLEEYRLDALVDFAAETQQSVYYTIHDWRLAGAENSRERIESKLDHWFTADAIELADAPKIVGNNHWTYVNGGQQKRPIWYWDAGLFTPLRDLWW
jgi:hypothetical protein